MNTPVICISGASSGIGYAIAEIFSEHGYHIALGARRLERLSEIKIELLKKGAASVYTGELDVRSQDSVANWTDQCFSRFNNIDILVNNAGLVIGTDTIEQGRIDEWEAVIDTNLFGVLRLCRAFLPHFRSQASGHLVMIGSISGHQVYEGGGPYCASKFGVKALVQTLKLELNGTPIRVGSVDPGMVETEFSNVRYRGDKDRAKQVYQGMQPLHARDVAECVHFMCSRPKHVNIDDMIVMPSDQASVYKVHREY